jgi:hypothetical protein
MAFAWPLHLSVELFTRLRQNTTKDTSKGVIPESSSERLLVSPHGVNNHHAGQYSGFENTQKEHNRTGERLGPTIHRLLGLNAMRRKYTESLLFICQALCHRYRSQTISTK